MVVGTLVAKDDTWILWAIIIGWATISIFLEERYRFASIISGAIIALVGAMLLSNFHIIPTTHRCMTRYGTMSSLYQYHYYYLVRTY